MSKIKEGQLAIDFTLPDQNGKLHKLSDYKGKWILLCFYTKDNTPGCTK
jgi:peroxiredoxin Q/BCP